MEETKKMGEKRKRKVEKETEGRGAFLKIKKGGRDYGGDSSIIKNTQRNSIKKKSSTRMK